MTDIPNPRRHWTSIEHASLCYLYHQGFSDRRISGILKRSITSIRDHRLKTGLAKEEEWTKDRAESQDKDCDSHLADLKRYCDYNYPEFNIPPERPAFITAHLFVDSLIGSPSAMCADE